MENMLQPLTQYTAREREERRKVFLASPAAKNYPPGFFASRNAGLNILRIDNAIKVAADSSAAIVERKGTP